MASKNITKYTPGFNIHDVQKRFNIKKIVKLSSNENPFISDKVTKYINDNEHGLNLYPESKPTKLQSIIAKNVGFKICLLYTSPSPRDRTRSRMPSSA